MFIISLSADNRTRAGVAGGDELEVVVELDDEPLTVTVPDGLASAFASDLIANKPGAVRHGGRSPTHPKSGAGLLGNGIGGRVGSRLLIEDAGIGEGIALVHGRGIGAVDGRRRASQLGNRIACGAHGLG